MKAFTKAEPTCFKGAFNNAEISAELPLGEIGEIVMTGKIVVLKGVFSNQEDDLLALRRAVLRWAEETPATPAPDPQENSHCFQAGVSKLQQTPHIYHSFNFNRISQLPANLSGPLGRYFGALALFQNRITGNSGRLEGFEDGAALHPQLIQYPQGGSFFGRHSHPLLPQRIGLIASLSRRGIDFDKGGACFETDGTIVETEAIHDFGDIALFRFDLPHWVTHSDPKDKFSWDSEKGRWSMVLPYF